MRPRPLIDIDGVRTIVKPALPNRTKRASDRPTTGWPTKMGRAALATAIALVAYLSVSFGLFATAPWWVTPLLIGAITASVAREPWLHAALETAAGLMVGLLFFSPAAAASGGDVTGLLVPPHDEGAMATAIVRLLQDHALRARLAATGRARATDYFGVDRMVSETLAVYQARLR